MGQYEKDKKYLLEWLEKYCHGYVNARTKEEILPLLLGKWNERYFRRVTSDLKKENHVSSTSDKGYWFNPLVTKDREEIKAEMQSAMEMKSRALSIIEGADRRIKSCQDRLSEISYQPTFGF